MYNLLILDQKYFKSDLKNTGKEKKQKENINKQESNSVLGNIYVL